MRNGNLALQLLTIVLHLYCGGKQRGFSGGFSIPISVHVKHWPHNHGSELGKIGYCYLAFQRPRRLHRPLFVWLWLRNLKRGKLDSRSETVRPPSASPPSSSSHGVTAHNALPTFEQYREPGEKDLNTESSPHWGLQGWMHQSSSFQSTADQSREWLTEPSWTEAFVRALAFILITRWDDSQG